VTTQAQILELIKAPERTGMAVMMITHDLGVVAEMCEEVVVMYLGEVVEQAPCRCALPRPAAPLYPGAAALDPAPGGQQGQ
jgi:peptide/nickel transport system ATP-binding protein